MYQWRRHYGYADHNKLLWLYNAYLIQITHIWQNQGFAEVRQWLKKDNSFAQIIDWLLAEGFNQGFPDKNLHGNHYPIEAMIARSHCQKPISLNSTFHTS